MTSLLETGLLNAALATVLAIGVWITTRIWRQPVVAHALWVIVLCKLVTPPMVHIPWRFMATAATAPASSEIVAPLSASQTRDQATHKLSVMPPASHEVIRAPDSLSWATVAATFWGTGSAIFLVVAIVRLARFHRALAESAPASEELHQWAELTAMRLGVSRPFRLRVTEGRLSPLVWPVGRPTILLSRPLLAELSPEETQTLLAHELAHLRRKDHWLRWLELWVSTLYWWHPVTWWARTVIHRSEEAICDAWVVSTIPAGATTYASALFKTAQFILPVPPSVPAVASTLKSSGDLKERIENIMGATWSFQLTLPIRLMVVLLACATLPLSVRWVLAEDQSLAPTREGALEGGAAGNPHSAESSNDRPNGDPLENTIQPGSMLNVAITGDKDSVNVSLVAQPSGDAVLGPPYGTINLGGLTVAEAEAALAAHVKTIVKRATVHLMVGGIERPSEQIKPLQDHAEYRRIRVPADPYHVSPGDVLHVAVANASPDAPIADDYVVEPSGTLALGPQYGRVKVAALTLEDAERVVTTHLKTILRDPQVQITLGGWRNKLEGLSHSYRETAHVLGDTSFAADFSLPQNLGSESRPSVRILKKIVERKKLDYERAQSLASNRAISISELEKEKSDYEISIAKYEQALRAVKYNELLVDLAEIEYQQAVDASKAVPNSLPKTELRKLEIKVELAKARLAELVD